MFNSIFKDYKLVGGIYFALLMDFRKKYTDGKKYQEKQDDIFRKLVKLLGFKDLSNLDTLSDRISRYKRCTDENLTNNFTKDVIDKISDYKTFSSICEDLKKFFDEKYESEDDKKNLLVAIRNLLLEDSEIKRKNEKFRVTNSGDFLTRNEIESNKEFSFEPFILGTLFYAITIPNMQGANTFDYLFSKQGRDYKYNGKLNNASDSEIKITHFKKQDSFIPVKEEQTRFQEKKLDYSLNDDDFDYFYESCSTEIDNLSLLDKIQEKQKLYIETDSYKEGIKKLERYGVLLITGNPGDGKSTTAEMIAVKYTSTHKCNIHYYYGYSEGGSIIQQFKTNPNKDTEELYYIDDFLGQAVYELDNNQESNLAILFSFIRQNRNKKKLILCSRIKIIEDNLAESIKERFLDKYLEDDYHLVIRYSTYEKGQILLHHLIEKTDKEHFNDIKKNKRYLEIINNKSFIPRTIEHVCKNYKKVLIENDGDFLRYFNEVLSNPECIWRNVYNNDLTEEGRTLLAALYTLTNNRAELRKCNEVFNLLIKGNNNASPSINLFNRALSEINDSMVVVQKDYDVFISFADPSVHDYLMNSVFTQNSSAFNMLSKGIIYSRQIYKLYGNTSILYYIKLAQEGKLLELSFDGELNKIIIVFRCIHKIYIMREDLKIYFRNQIKNLSTLIKNNNGVLYTYDFMLLLETFINNPSLRQFYLDGPIDYGLFNLLTYKATLNSFFSVIRALNNNPTSVDFTLDDRTKKEILKNYLKTDFAVDYTSVIDSIFNHVYGNEESFDEISPEELFGYYYPLEIRRTILNMDFFLPKEELEKIYYEYKQNQSSSNYTNNNNDFNLFEEQDNSKEEEGLDRIDDLFSHSYEELKGEKL